MGCTSSTPNMSDPHSHTTENDKRENNDDEHDDDNLEKNDTNDKKDPKETESSKVECNETKLLPTCDSLEKNIQLDRKNIPTPDIINEQERDMAGSHIRRICSLGLRKTLQKTKTLVLLLTRNSGHDSEVNIVMEVEKEIPTIELEEETHKLLTFEKLVDRVVLDSILDDTPNVPDVQENDLKNEDKTTKDIKIQDNTKNIIVANVNEDASKIEELEGINDEEDNNETASPSQSECSRATRWEALADIAAELPPSLAVDPLTGEIFTLTK